MTSIWDKSLPSGSNIAVHNIDGDVTVVPSSSGKVEVLGAKSGRDTSDVYAEVHETRDGIVICVMWRHARGTCDEEGYNSHSRHGDWNSDDASGSMDLEVRIPAGMRVSAGSVSGNVHVTGAEGDLRVHSVSGDVQVESSRATSFVASSVSGDVSVKATSLTGSGRLSAKSVSGNITLELPKDFAADVRMTTVSGDLQSDFPMTLEGRQTRRGLEGKIGSGGRDLQLSTVSGNVRIRIAK
ncbi:MAG: DUF4097 domain-containing protein [Gemmatimonadota bacterium]|nr:DUF4097 domain-containing protein [Gemmatimonadota bacterium]